MTLRIVSRTARSIHEQERADALRRREAAGTLAAAFPRCEVVRIHLNFVSSDRRAPAARTHELHPSAHAYFEFSCPYGDCDGNIDLSEAVVDMLRAGGTQAHGVVYCPGTRLGNGGARPPCRQRVDFWVVARHHTLAKDIAGRPALKRPSPGS